MEDNTINHTGSEENVSKVSKSEENGNLDVLGLDADRTSTENNGKNFTSECSGKLQKCVQDSSAHEIHSKKIGIHDSTSEWKSACILPSTHKKTVFVIPNTHTEPACILPKTHAESACKVPCTHTESACIMPNTHTESVHLIKKVHAESACKMPSTRTESACVMPKTQRENVERTQVDSDPEISKDSFQTYVNSEQNKACENKSKNKCNIRNMKNPNFINVSTAQNSSQHSGLVIPNKDLSKLFSPSLSITNLPYMIFPTTNLNTTTCKSQIQINTRTKKYAQATEKEEHNLEKELFPAIHLQGIMNDTEKEREHSKKIRKKHVTFSSSITIETEDFLETNSLKNNGDELFMKNINTSIQNEKTADSIMVRFSHRFLSVMEHMCNFAFSKFSSAISEAWEATTIAYKDGNVKYDGPKPRSSLQSHVNRIASKRKLLLSYVDETESEMKIVKRICRTSVAQSNYGRKTYASS
jgi:hypothetical protein